MKPQSDFNRASETVQPVIKPSFWKRFRDGYRYKMRTDQSFFATVVALQIVSIILFLLVVGFVIVNKSHFGSPGTSRFFKKF